MTSQAKAAWLSLLIPVALLGGAIGSEVFGGLFPCEMCYWQRWPHEAAIAFALLGLFIHDSRVGRLFIALAALAILASGLIGMFHAGVEYKWWDGITACTRPPSNGGDFMKEIFAAPTVSCDQPQWTLGPISLAGFNAIFSIGGAFLVFWFLRKKDA